MTLPLSVGGHVHCAICQVDIESDQEVVVLQLGKSEWDAATSELVLVDPKIRISHKMCFEEVDPELILT